MSIRKKARASHLVGTEILTPMGLPTMYKQFLKACKDEILDALRVFTDTNNYPIHVHCTQGKDRTGMVCMLLLGIAGAPDEVVIKDYARTQEGLAPVLPMMVKEMAKSGLSAEFATARPEVMLRKIGEGRESRSFAMPSFAQLLHTSIFSICVKSWTS
jgi:hypothetical protein